MANRRSFYKQSPASLCPAPPKHAKLEGRRFGSHQDGRKRRRAMEEEGVADLTVLAQYSTCYTLSVFAPTSRTESSVRPRVVRITSTPRPVLQG